MNYEVIIPAAGQGKRMKSNMNKQFLHIEGQPIIVHTLRIFDHDPNCKAIHLVVNDQEINMFHQLLMDSSIKKAKSVIRGGSERQYSVYNGIKQIQSEGIVLVHDGARPFVSREVIDRTVKEANLSGAAVAAVPVKDTIKKVKDGKVIQTIERSSLWSIQTPQAFQFSLLKEAYEKAEEQGFVGTDDASLVEYIGRQVSVVLGDYDNIKITTPEDMSYAELVIKKRIKQ